MQLVGLVVPHFQKMQREGESGHRKMNQYTRYLTVLILLIQAPSFCFNLRATTNGTAIYSSLDWTVFIITATIILAAGSMFVLWLGERITDKGIGNGVSLIIMIGIIARLPQAFIQELISRFTAPGQGGLVVFLMEIIIFLGVIAAAILLVQGTRRVPVQYAKRVVGNRQYGGARQYIPLKPYAANVMPIIFAQAIMMIPVTVAGYIAGEKSAFMTQLFDITSWTYNIIYAVLIIFFTYLYTAITINPTQMAEDMKRNNGFIPGVKPGKNTADYIDRIMSRITLPGSLFLAFIAILPAFARMFGVQNEFAQFFGGTSLLILVGVVLDTLQQIESHLLMRHYDGLLENTRVRGAHSAY
jgi:preprotein translocase subunit SecY